MGTQWVLSGYLVRSEQVESAAEPSEAEKAYSAKLAKLKQVKQPIGCPSALPPRSLAGMAAPLCSAL